jgi:hypothetical protein
VKSVALTKLVAAVSLGTGPLLGCSPLTEEGSRVVIVDDANAVVDCERIGRVYAESVFGGVMSYVGCQRVRAQRTEVGESRSTGLRLFIAKGIVEAPGGRICVESQPGRGTVFRFTLSKSQAPQASRG